jgi:hypothetical protein
MDFMNPTIQRHIQSGRHALTPELRNPVLVVVKAQT